jgi:hypothetical protein
MIKQCSSDARNEGEFGCSLYSKVGKSKDHLRAAGTSQRASTDQINRVGVVSYQSEADNAAHSLISVEPVD